MRILVVASFNKGRFAPFIVEQVEALKKQGCSIEFFGLQGKGLLGYLRNLPLLKRKIKAFCPDVIHAHYGLSGLLANLQRHVPVVTTYHGSDINDKKVLPFSKMAMRLSAWNVFVSRKTLEIAKPKKKYILLPCGIDLSDLQLTERAESRRKMGLQDDRKYVLFAGAFDIPVKNAPLAKDTVACLHDNQTELLELKGYSREEVTLLMCAADAFLMTSQTEGSPQVIKEAMACGCPIVSVDVGDVKERVEGLEGCFVSDSRNPNDLANLLGKAFAFGRKTDGRKKIVADSLDNRLVAKQLFEIYERVLRRENH
ncbi:MAG: glycosyltransferase [Bacteroidales bacterium]|nr:glycosyltransferase [Bacteroidales bacterium]